MTIAAACSIAARQIRIPLSNKILSLCPHRRYYIAHNTMKLTSCFPHTKNAWNFKSRGLLKPTSNVVVTPVAKFGAGAAFRVVGTTLYRLTKLRYLFVGATAVGGASAYKKVDEWKDKLSGATEYLDKIKGSIPDFREYGQKLSDLGSSMNLPDLKPQFSMDWLKNMFSDNFSALADPEVIQTIVQKKSEDDAEEACEVTASKDVQCQIVESDVVEEIQQQSEEELIEQILTNQREYSEKVSKLTEENKELRRSLLLREGDSKKRRKIKRTTTDMYSHVLDELDRYNRGNNEQDHLPRVVVVGDQSAGKTSVLEMIAQARIFPRGAGEMMTRSPVKVTMSEGPRHVASFNDSGREYNLKNKSELEALRNEIEARMRRSVSNGETVSNETISLTVKGPGLKRIVLVDLPGVISTVTTGMAKDTRSKIREMCQKHMENPNAIILCIQDGSIDAERSNVTDLVSSMDPSGKRTIFVMTKVDVAENNKYNPERIQKILEGKLFPMKALGYFAVVTGKGNAEDSIDEIKKYEEEFFKNSTLLRKGVLMSNQLSTENLSLAVSKCFWKMVEESVHEQENLFRATSLNLQREWEFKYPNARKLDREELFAKARREILDEVATISEMHEQHWDETFKKELWNKISDNVFNIYLKAATKESAADFNLAWDIELRNFAERVFPNICLQVGQSALQGEFKKSLLSITQQDPLLSKIKEVVCSEGHEWDRRRAEDSLRFFAKNILSDKDMFVQETNARQFMQSVIQEKLKEAEKDLSNLVGPGSTEMWLSWKSRTPEQWSRRKTVEELERLYSGKHMSPDLDKDQLTALRKNLEVQSIAVDDAFIQDSWTRLHRVKLLKKTLNESNSNQQSYFGSWFASNDKKIPDDMVFFWKVEKMLEETSKVLRKQLLNYEIQRFETNMKNSLDKIGDDDAKLKSVISGERVDLVEKQKSVKYIQELLSEFIEALKKEKA